MTDIHFGRKANSNTHNQDCIDFLNWFAAQVKADPDIDFVAFLGDWNENRSALNISTLNYSYLGAKILNDLGLPVYFIIGNHDLYHRHTREVHSVIPFNEFSNFILVEEPTLVKEIGDGVLFCPFMFHDEYPGLANYNHVPFWAGHFEFKGFEVTGYGMKMPTGPEASLFKGPKYIVSGHFHKRQVEDNVIYIGNTFPMDFGDAGDDQRGMMIHDFEKDEMVFENWDDCPRYTKTTLTDILDGTVVLQPKSRVKCIVDVPITFEESGALKQSFTEKHNLREFILEESLEIKNALEGTDVEINWDDDKLAGVDELVQQMLNEISSEHIQNDMLVDIYNGLQIQK